MYLCYRVYSGWNNSTYPLVIEIWWHMIQFKKKDLENEWENYVGDRERFMTLT